MGDEVKVGSWVVEGLTSRGNHCYLCLALVTYSKLIEGNVGSITKHCVLLSGLLAPRLTLQAQYICYCILSWEGNINKYMSGKA